MLRHDMLKILQSPEFVEWYIAEYGKHCADDLAIDLFFATPSPLSDSLVAGEFSYRRENALLRLNNVCAEYIQSVADSIGEAQEGR